MTLRASSVDPNRAQIAAAVASPHGGGNHLTTRSASFLPDAVGTWGAGGLSDPVWPSAPLFQIAHQFGAYCSEGLEPGGSGSGPFTEAVNALVPHQGNHFAHLSNSVTRNSENDRKWFAWLQKGFSKS